MYYRLFHRLKELKKKKLTTPGTENNNPEIVRERWSRSKIQRPFSERSQETSPGCFHIVVMYRFDLPLTENYLSDGCRKIAD